MPYRLPPLPLRLLLCAWLGASGAALAAENPQPGDAPPPEPSGVRIDLRKPVPGTTVRGRMGLMELTGLAQADDRALSFDLMLVIDVSGSTLYASGLDIDGDGEFGVRQRAPVPGLPETKSSDPDDSILAAEIMAAKRLLRLLDPERVRIGVVSFAGEASPITLERRSPDQQDAWLEHPLTRDYAQVENALQAVRLRGAGGGTDMQAGVKLAVRELAGLGESGTVPAADATRRKVLIMLTDGRPSLPFGRVDIEDPEDTNAVIEAARLASEAGIIINVFGLGPDAGNYPYAVTQVTQATGGLYTPVRRPGDVVTLLTGVSFANIEDVVAVNLTLGQMSGPQDVSVLPDGSFRGFVPVRPGRNRIRLSALTSDGRRGSREFDVEYVQMELSGNELREELERVRERNRQIQILTERRRQEAFREAGFTGFRGVSPSRLDLRGLLNEMRLLGTSAEKPARSP